MSIAGNLRRIAPSALLLAPLVVLLLVYWVDRPFSEVLASKTIRLKELSTPQKLNIANAALALDGTVIKPGEEFSFNRVVGPRTSPRGYLAAPSYVGKDSPATIGGGICVLSSAIYIDALHSGMDVTERVAHLRTTRTIPHGMDATVWYGSSDLRFKNSLDCPLELVTKYSPEKITVELRGHTHLPNWAPCDIQRSEHLVGRDRVRVEIISTKAGKTRIVSRDMYGLTGVSHQ